MMVEISGKYPFDYENMMVRGRWRLGDFKTADGWYDLSALGEAMMAAEKEEAIKTTDPRPTVEQLDEATHIHFKGGLYKVLRHEYVDGVFAVRYEHIWPFERKVYWREYNEFYGFHEVHGRKRFMRLQKEDYDHYNQHIDL